MKAQLILENGKRFAGTLFGAEKNTAGEVIFTTGVVGYQETLTDPAMTGQILIMTFPLIGNYGINFEDMESDKARPKAVIMREKCNLPSNFRNEMNLDDFLRQQGIVGLEGIDTRALTRMIRDEGVMKGVIVKGDANDEEIYALMEKADAKPSLADISAEEAYTVNDEGEKHIAFIDLGTRKSVIGGVAGYGCRVTIFPALTSAETIENANPDAVYVSNGPENPAEADAVIDTIKTLIKKYPVFGTGLGHRMIGAALGCGSERLTFGHHGSNYPVKDLKTGSVFITTQNHITALTDLPDDVEQTFVNVNDGTCQGIRHKTLHVESVEFQPNTLTGAAGTGWIFGNFLKEVK